MYIYPIPWTYLKIKLQALRNFFPHLIPNNQFYFRTQTIHHSEFPCNIRCVKVT